MGGPEMAPHTPQRPGRPGEARATVDTLNRRVVLATLNPGKLRELARLLGDLPIELLSLADIPGATLPEETGRTYADNALLKARAARRLTGCAALGDDSGLEVDALGGAPGVRSARFGGAGLDDAGRVEIGRASCRESGSRPGG